MLRDERREFSRVNVELSIMVSPRDADRGRKALKNISLGGAFWADDNPLPAGTECTLHVELSDSSSPLNAEVEGEVVRADEHGVAIRFTSIDLDSFLKLRRLVQSHSLVPQVIEDEFDASFR